MAFKSKRLWRVSWFHRDGYQAPHYWVEAERGYNESETRKNAIEEAKKHSRLADFPHVWSCRIEDVTAGSYLSVKR